ncbi:hypothetical protein [Mammaliicoccus sciuri]|uniref:hypothetical protein n=1 Tax=Mammaliicoccus sciuri TaxID=1296 RepID=UPI00195203DD|nr:hypothetical protein [Mammaliicoccus sciuri]
MTMFIFIIMLIIFIMILFNIKRKQQILQYVDDMRNTSLKTVTIRNINHILKNRRNNFVLVYTFGKIELLPGQIVFVRSGEREGISIPQAKVNIRYKKFGFIPLYPIKIKDKDLMNFYQRELKIYITRERFNSLKI